MTTAETPKTDAPEGTDSADSNKPQTLEEMLASLPEEHKTAVLGELSKARKDAASYRTKLREAEPLAAEAKKLADAKKSDEDRAREALDTANKRADTFRSRAVGAEVKAIAAKGFADADDALAFIDPAKYVNDDGEIDSAAIETDLADLLKRKPHLAAQATATKTGPAHDKSQASSASGSAAKSPEDAFASWWNLTK